MIGLPNLLILVVISCSLSSCYNYGRINKYDGINMQEAQLLASRAQKKTQFPINVNPEVLSYLNQFLGKPSARLQMKACLKRMKEHQKVIKRKIKELDVPAELMAIPIIESGYQNIHSKGSGSGLWMLIERTALAKGLTIDEVKDERLDVERSTEVALNYIKSNHRILKNWQLAILAYNVGESKVRWAIIETRSQDPWELIKQGFENDKGYLAKIMAAIIIMKNPEVLN
jgi:membrane-bound lytic murein transglycosylase D